MILKNALLWENSKRYYSRTFVQELSIVKNKCSILPHVFVKFHHLKEQWGLSATYKLWKFQWMRTCPLDISYKGLLIKASIKMNPLLQSNLGLPSHFIRATEISLIDSLVLYSKPCCTTVNPKMQLNKHKLETARM